MGHIPHEVVLVAALYISLVSLTLMLVIFNRNAWKGDYRKLESEYDKLEEKYYDLRDKRISTATSAFLTGLGARVADHVMYSSLDGRGEDEEV